jgi:DnaJ-domain-containing protein 1
MLIPIVAALTLSFQTGAQLEQKVQSVLPTAEEERWQQIPWRTNLMRARAEAQQSGKPLFLWIMNGHPLGCT